MRSPSLALHALFALTLLHNPAHATVTIYNSAAQARLEGISTTSSATSSAPTAAYTGAADADPVVLIAPAVPAAFNPEFTVDIGATIPAGASIAQSGSFLGFSIEFSVADQVIGFNSTVLQVPFLNLMSNLASRGGQVRIRVGGNTQDYATLNATLPNNKILLKDKGNNTNPTETPSTWFTADLIYMLGNTSALVDIGWWLGIPLNETQVIRLGIAEVGEAILGDKLLGFQVGNEPDLYADHGHRPSTYGPADYVGEFGEVVAAMNNDPNTPNRNNLLIGPSVSGTWTPEQVFDAGFVTNYSSSIAALAVEHYPSDNCAALYPADGFTPVNPQAIFPEYLSHTSGQTIVNAYLDATGYAQSVQKPFIMFETNTASCGGFPGLSDSFGAALWTADYALQMAYANFSGANLHVSGQDVYYNPFSPPPTNESTVHGWTVWPTYYATLAVAEAFGTAGNVRVVDMFANNNNNQTPAYVLYENNAPARVALFNYVTDPSGASDLKVTLQVPAQPSSVQVKLMHAASVADKFNVTWANQTFGDSVFASDGRFEGQESILTVPCTAGACIVTVPAPSMALVFLTSSAFQESEPSTEATFATTATTNPGAATATINSAVLATSNGHSGQSRKLGSTSKGSSNDAAGGKGRGGMWGAVVGTAMGVIALGAMVLT